jgi:extracellular elastinolytic metalloproteinase
MIWQDPTDGFTTVTDPFDSLASPNGWHQNGPTDTGATSGNNVIAYKADSDRGTTSQSSRINNYVYNFDSRNTAADIKNASTVNAFYLGNMMHDLLYHYGTYIHKKPLSKVNQDVHRVYGDCIQFPKR